MLVHLALCLLERLQVRIELVGIAGDGLDFSHREDARGGGFGEGFERRGRASLFGSASRLAAEADVVATPPPGAWINLSLARERVDLRV